MKIKSLLACAAFAAFSMNSQIADAASATASATAEIVPAIAITKVNDLRFGTVAAGTAVGTVTITPAGARSKSGSVSLSNVSTGGAASFTVSGHGTSTYSITLPSSGVTISDGTNNMTVDTFTSNPSATGTLAAGTQTLTVGGTLNVGANQATGSYTGTFNVTVEYN